jgi:hypothetical protein
MTKPKNIKEILEQASPDARKLITKVLKIEEAKLNMSRPSNLKEEILTAIRKEIKE